MQRTLAFAYGVVAYLIFLSATVYAIGFFANFLVPKGIDTGVERPTTESLLINLSLLGLFAVQHTVMARENFKRWWVKIFPQAIERSTFVLLASVILILLFWQWRPMPASIWSVTNALGRDVLWVVYAGGWVLILASTFAINHFDFFGLRQVWLHFRGRAYAYLPFKIDGLYRLVRHPMMTGFLIVFWATPHMTVGHALFAAAATVYILVGIQFEERDLVRVFGDKYRAYRKQAPMLVPWRLRPKASA